jgi:beta-phosphoglucomutase-like phosphatase (HAD superfamily)
MKNVAAILFDWDGTLLDSYPAGYRASSAVFRHYGIELNREIFLSTYNPNWYETYKTIGLPSEEWANADRILSRLGPRRE